MTQPSKRAMEEPGPTWAQFERFCKKRGHDPKAARREVELDAAFDASRAAVEELKQSAARMSSLTGAAFVAENDRFDELSDACDKAAARVVALTANLGDLGKDQLK